MKGIILHGGSGTRLRPLTYTDVKQLLPVAGKPISEYALINMINIGIKDFIIVIGNIGGDEVKNYYKNGEKWNVNIKYVYQDKPLGIANAILLAKDLIKNDDFIVYLGDNILEDKLNNLYKKFIKNNYDAMLVLTKVKNPEQFGIAYINNDKIVKLEEKPKDPKSNYAITGLYFLKSNIFDILKDLKPSKRNEYEITDAFQEMLNKKMNLGYSFIDGWWKDTGTVEDFLDCNRLVLENIERVNSIENDNIIGRVKISEDAKIINSTIKGPAYIGKNTIIENSNISPYTSIGDNCIINGCYIEDSIIMDNVKINKNNLMISESIIGENSIIENSNYFNHFIIGRDSKIKM